MPQVSGLLGVESPLMLSTHQLSYSPEHSFCFLLKKKISQTFHLFILFKFVSMFAYTTPKLLLCFYHWSSEVNPSHQAWWQTLYLLSYLAKGLSDMHQVTL